LKFIHGLEGSYAMADREPGKLQGRQWKHTRTFSAWNVVDVGLNALGMCASGRAAFSEGRKLQTG